MADAKSLHHSTIIARIFQQIRMLARYSILRFDDVILSHEWKKALWGKCATTTHAAIACGAFRRETLLFRWMIASMLFSRPFRI